MPLRPASMLTCWDQVPGNSPVGTESSPHRLPAYCGSVGPRLCMRAHASSYHPTVCISLPLIPQGDPVATSSLQSILTGRVGAYAG